MEKPTLGQSFLSTLQKPSHLSLRPHHHPYTSKLGKFHLLFPFADAVFSMYVAPVSVHQT